jgi:aspartyl protease family protein
MFGLDEDRTMSLVYLVALLALLLVFGGFRRRSRRRRASRMGHLFIWALIAVALAIAYAYRAPLSRFAAPVLQELDPSRVVEVTNPDGETELVIARRSDGHFHLDADVNGAPVRFLVDTGASGTVLTVADATRSGIDTDALAFNRPVQTANGTAYYARATLGSLEIGPWRLSDVPVGVMRDEALGVSLLGMSTIDRFASWRIEGDRMVLVP